MKKTGVISNAWIYTKFMKELKRGGVWHFWEKETCDWRFLEVRNVRLFFLKDLDVRCHPAGLHGSKSCPLISFLYNFHWFFPLYIDLVAFLWWPLYVLTMCELWSSLFLFVRMVTKIKEVSEDDSWWFHLISVAPIFDHIWKAGPHLIWTTAPSCYNPLFD